MGWWELSFTSPSEQRRDIYLPSLQGRNQEGLSRYIDIEENYGPKRKLMCVCVCVWHFFKSSKQLAKFGVKRSLYLETPSAWFSALFANCHQGRRWSKQPCFRTVMDLLCTEPSWTRPMSLSYGYIVIYIYKKKYMIRCLAMLKGAPTGPQISSSTKSSQDLQKPTLAVGTRRPSCCNLADQSWGEISQKKTPVSCQAKPRWKNIRWGDAIKVSRCLEQIHRMKTTTWQQQKSWSNESWSTQLSCWAKLSNFGCSMIRSVA